MKYSIKVRYNEYGVMEFIPQKYSKHWLSGKLAWRPYRKFGFLCPYTFYSKEDAIHFLAQKLCEFDETLERRKEINIERL